LLAERGEDCRHVREETLAQLCSQREASAVQGLKRRRFFTRQ
jgi:hypothetical protein